VYDYSEFDTYYCPELVKEFYTCIETTTIDLDHHQFTVHFETGDIMVTIDIIEDYTQVSSSPLHTEPLPLIEYMSIMGVPYVEYDRGLKASSTFCNVHCVGRWIQYNTLGFDHTTSFNRLMLQIIHNLMTRQHTVWLNTVIFHSLIANSQRTRGAKYSNLVLVTRLCRNFLSDAVYSAYDRVLVARERITSTYNSCLQAVWTFTVQSEDIPAESSSEEQLEEEDEPEFWRQPPPTDSRAFMSSIWKGMKKIFKGQTRLWR